MEEIELIMDDITGIINIINMLPTSYKIVFIFIFFAAPKIIQMIGGPKVVSEIIRRYQARKQRQIEDEGLTEAYTRTLVVESLGLFSNRLSRMDHKINHIVHLLDKDAEIEVIESVHPKRTLTETLIHNRLHQRLEEMRKQREKR